MAMSCADDSCSSISEVLNVSAAVEVGALFPAGVFGAPCTEVEIATAERALGHKLPPILQELYRAFDGFVGPTGTQFLYPLLKSPHKMKTSLVEYTKFLRTEFRGSKGYIPELLQRSVAVGDTGIGPAGSSKLIAQSVFCGGMRSGVTSTRWCPERSLMRGIVPETNTLVCDSVPKVRYRDSSNISLAFVPG
jgi:hypothetical protein